MCGLFEIRSWPGEMCAISGDFRMIRVSILLICLSVGTHTQWWTGGCGILDGAGVGLCCAALESGGVCMALMDDICLSVDVRFNYYYGICILGF